MHLVPGQWIGGEFRIVRPLAEGGMGAVFVAEQRGTGKLRALKTLHAPIAHDAAAVERFVREARVGASIASEHVVEVVSAGIDEPTGMAFIAMELLEGETLEAHVLARGPMRPSEVMVVLRQLVHALSAAHRAGIVHRDLKPQNVMLVHARRGDSPFTVKVLDFGIAKLLDHATSAGNSQVIGSPPWMAPEQLDAGAPISPATDVWSVGLITFFMLTARPYWRAATASIPALVAEIVLSPLVPASERARELGAAAALPHAFDAWFAGAVARSPADRFPSVDAMLDALAVLVIAPAPSFGHVALPPLAQSAVLAPTVASSTPPPLAPRGTVPIGPTPPVVAGGPSLIPPAAPNAGTRWMMVGLIVAALVVVLPWVLGFVAQFGPWNYTSLLTPEPERDPDAVAACRQARACCEAVNGASACPSITDGWSAEHCMMITRRDAFRQLAPAVCFGPPANVVALVRAPPANPPAPSKVWAPPVPLAASPVAASPLAAPPLASAPPRGSTPSLHATVTECVRATRCCQTLVGAELSRSRDECETVRQNMVAPGAAASCDAATRDWAERYRSAGRPIPGECAIPP